MTESPAPVTSFRMPQRVLVGGGARRELADVVAELGLRRPLIVTDEFHDATGVAADIAGALERGDARVAVFSGAVPDPTTTSVDAAVAAAAAHDADSVVGLGGGSPLDTAKAVALLAVRGGAMRDYKAPAVTTGAALPVIAVPTTAGSGSEATQFTIITDDANAEKMLCIGPVFLPRVAVVDFELSLTAPPRLTADTGIDALTHAIEAYVSRKANPLSDTFAIRAMQLIGEHLVPVYRDGDDRRARERMMLAAHFAGVAFSNSSVALVHGMSRPIGAHFHLAHGLSNALLFAEVTRFSLPGAESRYADCARALGVADAGTSDAAAASALVAAIEHLVTTLEVPPASALVDADAWHAAIPQMADQALASGSPANNPVIPDAAQIAELYRRVYAR